MTGGTKHSLIDSNNTPACKKFKTEIDDIDSKYKVENYITEQEINDIIERQTTISSGIKKTKCSVFDVPVSVISHNVIVNPETGKVESIIRKECDKSMTPQTFYISVPSPTLDIIEEETDVNDLESLTSKNSVSTQTDFSEDIIRTYYDVGYPLQSSNLSVRCSSDSVSDWSDDSMKNSKISGFYQRYREIILKINSKTNKINERSLGILKSNSVPTLSNDKSSNFPSQRNYGNCSKNNYENDPLSNSQLNTNLTSLTKRSASLSNYLNFNSHKSLINSPSTTYRHYLEEIQRMKELCGLSTRRSYETDLSVRNYKHYFTDTTSTDWTSSSVSSSKSSNANKSLPPFISNTSTEWKKTKYSKCAPEPPRRTTKNLYTKLNWYDGYSSYSKTMSESETIRQQTNVLQKKFPKINQCSTSSTFSYCSDHSEETSKSITSSVIEEVTESLNELSRKIDTYIKKKDNRYNPIGIKDSSSDSGTDSTVRYVPDLSLTSDCYESDYAYIKKHEPISKIPTLKKLALKVVLSLKNGIDLLSDIYFVPPQKSTHLNKMYTKGNCYKYEYEHIPRCIPRILEGRCPLIQINGSRIAPLSSSSNKSSPIKMDLVTLLDNHQKFIERRGYFENYRNECFITDGTHSPKTPKSDVFNVDKNYTKELLEEAANLLAVRKYREMRFRECKKERQSEVVKTKMRNSSFEQRRKSLESIQDVKQFRADSIDQNENNVKSLQISKEKINPNLTRTYDVVNEVRSTASLTTKWKNGIRRKCPSATYDHDVRQKMFAEYMKKVAERIERRQKKMIRITKRPLSEPTMVKIFHSDDEQEKPNSLEEEFMQKARMRLHKLGISLEEQTTEGYGKIDVKNEELPNHLREFIQIVDDEDEDCSKTKRRREYSLFNEIDEAMNGFLSKKGVWSPSQTRKLERRSSDVGDQQKEIKNRSDSGTPVIWSPRSAPSSPTSERKTYKPVKFESPVLQKKNTPLKSREFPVSTSEFKFSDSNRKENQNKSTTAAQTKNEQSENSTYENERKRSGYIQRTEETEKTLTTTITNNANVINTTSKLPRVQNPTITLLQKAREGQLPKGAFYLDHNMNEKELRETNKRIQRNETVHTIQREYESENENSKRQKKMAQQSGRKSNGIGPTTKEGIPTVLRSELKNENHAKWYKQMYESLHKSYDDHDFVTIRYKTGAPEKVFTQNGGGYQSEPEQFSGYNSDFDASRYAASEVKYSSRNKENQCSYSTVPRSSMGAVRHAVDMYKNQPGKIENYEPGHSSIAQKEIKKNLNDQSSFTHSSRKPFSSLYGSGYESDSTLVFKRREDNQQPISPAEQRSLYKSIQKGGEVPFHGLRKPAPEKPKEPVTRTHDLFHPYSTSGGPTVEHHFNNHESPHKYAESEVTLQYKVPVRNEIKEAWSEEELNRRQAETMRRIYQEERRRKYLQELQDMSNRRHTDNFTPSQKSPIPLNRYDDVLEESVPQRSRSRTPEPKLVARALYNFTGQTSRELTFRKGDIIFVKRQIDKNWYEGEHNAMIGLFPINYVEIIPYDEIRTLPKRPSEGQARAKFNFVAQTNLELSLVKGELIILTRRVDDNWYEGRVGNRRGIFPVSYVNVIREPGEYVGLPDTIDTTQNGCGKPVASPAAHSLITNNHSVPSQHSYQPNSYTTPITLPRTTNRISQRDTNLLPFNETLHIDTSSEPIPYRALYNYKPQNEDELELREGDTVFVMEKCDDGWYVGSSQRTSHFGTFPGNYVERIS